MSNANAKVEFGLMLRSYKEGDSLHTVMAFNRSCIEALPANFSTLWMEDHLQWGSIDNLECFSSLCFFAGQYPQFRVGSLVLGQSYRNPALVAKMAANLQAISQSGIVLGIGAGWKEDEYIAYGYPFPPTSARLDQLEEAAILIRTMWQSQPATYSGKYYHIHDAYCQPQPNPPIPLLIGGGGEKRTLAIVARHADWWNFNSVPVQEYARKLDILKEHCQQVGRNISDITLSYLATLSVAENPSELITNPSKHYIAGTPEQVTAELEQFHALGITHFMFRIPNLQTLQLFANQVAPHFQ
jgi:alkanesulfonate monooxygenase SsuD/methylene tetrahydromethanopterin reductase-like flavin-dependent oxidoreductase (luciferase family)